MEIKNLEGRSTAQLREEVAQGGRFVVYKYCISIILMTFNRPTDIYYVPPGQSAVTPGLGFLFINLLLGWWGIPWGPIYTIGNIGTILNGGKDVTAAVMGDINQADPSYGTGNVYNLPGQQTTTAGNGAQSGTGAYNIPRS